MLVKESESGVRVVCAEDGERRGRGREGDEGRHRQLGGPCSQTKQHKLSYDPCPWDVNIPILLIHPVKHSSKVTTRIVCPNIEIGHPANVFVYMVKCMKLCDAGNTNIIILAI